VKRDEPAGESALRHILEDLKPLRPARGPWSISLLILGPWSLAGLLLVCLALRPRPDLEEIGIGFSWIASAAFLAAACALVALAAREAIPGSRAPASYLLAGLVAVLVLRLALSFVLHEEHPQPVPGGEHLRLALICSGAICFLALPLVLAGIVISRKGFPSSPGLLGVLVGFASVVAGEAIWRLHCPYTSPVHLITAHFPPYALVILAGIFIFRRFGIHRRR